MLTVWSLGIFSPRNTRLAVLRLLLVLYTHNHSHNHIIIIMISQSNGTCTNSNTGKYTTLTGELTVLQIRTFINFLTSEFGFSPREERDTILKSLSYHTMLTKLKRSAHLVEIFHLRWSGPEKLNRMPQRSKPKLLNTIVGTQLLLSVYMAQVDYRLDRSPFDNQLE